MTSNNSLRPFRFERGYLLPSFVVLLLLVLVVVYRGPGRAFIRGHVGDLLVVIFLYFLLGLVVASRRLRFIFVLLLAFGLELRQWLVASIRTQSFAAEMTIGATADIIDLVAYTLGLLIALWLERWLIEPDNP